MRELIVDSFAGGGGASTGIEMALECADGTHVASVQAFITKYYGADQAPQLDEPLHTVTGKDRFSLSEIEASLPPLTPTLHARAKRVARFLRKYGAWDGGEIVVTKSGHVVVDIGMRMLVARELFSAQGFPPTYIIDRGQFIEIGPGHAAKLFIKPTSKTDQVSKCGNSVCPPMSKALVEANFAPLEVNDDGVPEFAREAAE